MENSKQIKIGNYILGNTIGKGNSAVVKVATHSMTKQKVAIKIFDKSVLDSDKQLRLKREIESMKHLKKHDNIIKLYEIMETNKLICLVTEYASNGELYDFIIHKKRLSEREAKSIFRQIISAVYYCHSNRIVHRDLKVENLLLDSNWRIKLADFGFSSPFNPGELLDIYCGSPPYCAPELFLARRYDGTKVDIWSLGVILYVLVCGYLPFEANQFSVLRSQVINGSFKLPFFLSEECKNLINAMLTVDPLKRINLNEIIDHRWLNSDKNIEDDSSFKDFGSLIYKIENISIEENSPNEEVLNELSKKYHLDMSKVIESIVNNEFDSYSGLYYLTEASLYQTKPLVQQQFSTPVNLILPDPFKLNGYAIPKSKFEKSLQKCENFQLEKSNSDDNSTPIEELGRDYLTRNSAIRRHTIATNNNNNDENSNQSSIIEIGQSLNSNFNLPNTNSEYFNIDQDSQTIQYPHNPRKHSYHDNFHQNKCIKSKHESNAKNDQVEDFNYYLQPPVMNNTRRASDGGSNISLFNTLYTLKNQLCFNSIISSNNSLNDSENENFKKQSRGSITSGTPIAFINRSSDEDENDVNNNPLPSNSMKFQKRPSFSKGSRHEPYMEQSDKSQTRQHSFSGSTQPVRGRIHRASETNHQELLSVNMPHLEWIYNQSINQPKSDQLIYQPLNQHETSTTEQMNEPEETHSNLQIIQEEQTSEVTMITDDLNLYTQCFKKSYESSPKRNLISQ